MNKTNNAKSEVDSAQRSILMTKTNLQAVLVGKVICVLRSNYSIHGDYMSKKQIPTFKGRSLGIVTLTIAQLLIGAIHVLFGLLLFVFESNSFLPSTAVYDVYTVVFGLLASIFGVSIWQGKKLGWFGTIAISLFVIVADSLTLLDLPSIPGIPKFAGLGEITYSVLIIGYLCTSKVRKEYLGQVI